ncbi:MAG: cupin domain-containing protein [Pseudomonadota bacterium]
MPKLDLASVPVRTGTIYPAPYDAEVVGRSSLRLAEAGGLTQFGVNIVILAPGAKSSMRHWHLHEDEFVIMLSGACTLMQDAGPVLMQPGDCAAFPAGLPDGHCLVNHTEAEARFLVVGTSAPAETATYSDIDLQVHQGGGVNRFAYKDGTDWTGPR